MITELRSDLLKLSLPIKLTLPILEILPSIKLKSKLIILEFSISIIE